MVERQGIIVYLQHLKQAKSFRKYGHVHYISRKMKYVVLYCNKEEIDTVISKIERLPSVKKYCHLIGHMSKLNMKMQNQIRQKNMIIRLDYKAYRKGGSR